MFFKKKEYHFHEWNELGSKWDRNLEYKIRYIYCPVCNKKKRFSGPRGDEDMEMELMKSKIDIEYKKEKPLREEISELRQRIKDMEERWDDF